MGGATSDGLRAAEEALKVTDRGRRGTPLHPYPATSFSPHAARRTRSGWAVIFCCVVALGMSGVATRTSASPPERVDELIRATLELDPNVRRGAKLYRAHCAACHGKDASGDASRLVPALAGQRRAYLIKQLADFAELQRQSVDMHRTLVQREVDDPQEWSDITAYLNGLQPTVAPQTGSGEWVSLGEASYVQWCASCHGEDARGDDEGFIPSLRNQHYPYLLHQIRQLASGHRWNAEPELMLFLDSLDSDEMRGLADYLSRMRGPTRDRARMRDDGFVGD